MDDTATPPVKPKTTADYKAEFEHVLEAIMAVEVRMRAKRAVIERLKVETQVLKAESDLIAARVQSRLNEIALMS